MTLDGVTSFSRIKYVRNICKCMRLHVFPTFITRKNDVTQSKLLAGFLYVMAVNCKNLKVLIAFFIVLCVLESK